MSDRYLVAIRRNSPQIVIHFERGGWGHRRLSDDRVAAGSLRACFREHWNTRPRRKDPRNNRMRATNSLYAQSNRLLILCSFPAVLGDSSPSAQPRFESMSSRKLSGSRYWHNLAETKNDQIITSPSKKGRRNTGENIGANGVRYHPATALGSPARAASLQLVRKLSATHPCTPTWAAAFITMLHSFPS
jgi:hypothetical protein